LRQGEITPRKARCIGGKEASISYRVSLVASQPMTGQEIQMSIGGVGSTRPNREGPENGSKFDNGSFPVRSVNCPFPFPYRDITVDHRILPPPTQPGPLLVSVDFRRHRVPGRPLCTVSKNVEWKTHPRSQNTRVRAKMRSLGGAVRRNKLPQMIRAISAGLGNQIKHISYNHRSTKQAYIPQPPKHEAAARGLSLITALALQGCKVPSLSRIWAQTCLLG
jgi:hypothetical protein